MKRTTRSSVTPLTQIQIAKQQRASAKQNILFSKNTAIAKEQGYKFAACLVCDMKNTSTCVSCEME